MLKHRMDNLAVDCELGKLKIPGINNEEKFPEDSNTQINTTRNWGGAIHRAAVCVDFQAHPPEQECAYETAAGPHCIWWLDCAGLWHKDKAMKAPVLPVMEALVFDTTEKALKVPAAAAKLWGFLKAREPQ